MMPLALPDPTPEEAVQAMEVARRKAAVILSELVDDLGLRAADAATSTPNKLSIAEHLYKVSGMAAKQAAQENRGPAFSITISIPSVGGRAPQTMTISTDDGTLPDRDDDKQSLFLVGDDLILDQEHLTFDADGAIVGP